MKTWIIEPRDPLIVRDGRPFGPTPGARAATLGFPFPSTTTGGVRTAHGLHQGWDFSSTNPNKEQVIKDVLATAVRGPLLVQLMEDSGEIAEWFVPAPADALLFDLDPRNNEQAALRRLRPLALPDGAATNLPAGLTPVGLTAPDLRKPHAHPPRYWRWKRFEEWLKQPGDEANITLVELGHDGPLQEARTHVRITPDKLTAEDGALFQTRGLEFSKSNARGQLSSAQRLALAVLTDDSVTLPTGLAPLGGERRLMHWRASQQALPTSCPQSIRDNIVATQACRLVLLTPAYFEQGHLPTWLRTERRGITPQLKAITTGRAQVVSGWNFISDRPKPTRRLVPAGAVYFLKLKGKQEPISADAIHQWIDELWLACVSDDPQAQQDGFGLAALGSWSGQPEKMEV